MSNPHDKEILGWLHETFDQVDGAAFAIDPEERIIRLTEEVIELGQAEGMTRGQMHRLVNQVFNKPVGDPHQELGGVMVCLNSYAAVKGVNLEDAYQTEFDRCNLPEIKEKIRKKHETKAVVSSKAHESYGRSGDDLAAGSIGVYVRHGVEFIVGCFLRAFQHEKRGNTYLTLNEAELQSSAGPIEEGTKLTVYVGSDRRWWARPTTEFNDGRFTDLDAPLPQGD